MKKYDVAVIGGGFAGVAAAVAAMIFSSVKNFGSANLYLETFKPKNLFSAVMEDLARNGETR